MSRANNYGLSETELAVLVEGQIATQKAVQELARAIARDRGVELSGPQLRTTTPQPDGPQRRGRHRFARVTRHGPGDVMADVVNTETGQTRRFHLTKNGDGELEVDEL
jgi:hypothetical protein